MSANNYMLIHKIGKRYYVWDNLNAEEAVENKVLSAQNSTISFDTREESVAWAKENDKTEYGYRVGILQKPKDGFGEMLVTNEKI